MYKVKHHPLFDIKSWDFPSGRVDYKQLRSFGVIFFCFFSLFLGVGPLVFGESSPRIWALVTGLVFLTLALLFPHTLLIPYRIWMFFGAILGFINTRIILALIFFIMFTPLAIVRRLWGIDTLGFRNKRSDSYRISLDQRKPSSFYRQF